MRKPINIILLFWLALTSLFSCVVIENQYTALAPGLWRGQLILDQSIPAEEYDDDAVIQNIDETILPVMFQVNYGQDGEMIVEWINGEETIVSDSVLWGRDKATGKDSIRIEFPVYDSHISALYEERVIEGYWEIHFKENYRIPFVAFFGQSDRFKRNGQAPATDLSGRWACNFEEGTSDAYPAVAELNQQGNYLTGTFLTETGDYRFLEGIVQGDEFKLSCFDGAHAFLFEGKISGPDSIQGAFYSGKHYTAYWSGVRNDKAQLKEPLSLNSFEKDKTVEFTGINLTGNEVSTRDTKYVGLPKVVIIMGTWCPNCRDANNYLKSYIKTHPDIQDSVVFLAIAFEAYKERTKNLSAIEKYANKMEIPYDIWLGGNKDKKEASKHINAIDKVISYPTMLFVDDQDRLQYVHTGFSGPATKEYEKFDDLFNSLINDIK